jgi:phosphatidylinositol glycan class V
VVDRNTGFLRYWTVSNLPLFLLAAPMLTILVVSGVAQLKGGGVVTTRSSSSAETSTPPEKKNPTTPTTSTPSSATSSQQERLTSLLTSSAAAQVLLAILALTSYHVQIITRLSSGYPLWYWWVAGKLVSSEERDRVLANRIVTFMVVYAAVQGVLFASFLPPA